MLKSYFINQQKELFKYFDGEWDLPYAIEKIKQNSRIYSRKQVTWFKRDADITWFHPDQKKEILQFINEELKRLNNQI